MWKRLEMRAEEGSAGFLGEKNLEAKYQKTTMRMIPVRPKPPCCLPCGCGAAPPPSTTAAAGGAIFGRERERERAMESKI